MTPVGLMPSNPPHCTASGTPLDDRGAHEPAEQRVARARREPEAPGDEIPDDRTGEGGTEHGDRLVCTDGDDPGDRARDRRTEEHRTEDVPDAGECDRRTGLRGAGAHKRGDGVRGVVESVGDGEGECDRNPQHQARVHGSSLVRPGVVRRADRRTAAESLWSLVRAAPGSHHGGMDGVPTSRSRWRADEGWIGIAVVIMAALAVAAVVVGALWLRRGPTRPSVKGAVDRFRASSTSAGSSVALQPRPGVYLYAGTGDEHLSFLSTGQSQDGNLPGTVTTGADGCWTFAIDYNSFHRQTWSRCATDGRLVELGGTTDQRFDFGVFSQSEHTAVLCNPPDRALRPDDRRRWHGCRSVRRALADDRRRP